MKQLQVLLSIAFANALSGLCIIPYAHAMTPSELKAQLRSSIPSGLEANVKSTSIWPYVEIPVCWENASAANSTERSWVEQSVTTSWAATDAGNIRFTGWNSCEGSPAGIRIVIEDQLYAPHVKALGVGLDGMRNGMSLNFSFNNWSLACRSMRELCIKSIAVHEFGHALGFAHEHNRPDAPEWCRAKRQGTDGDYLISSFDTKSVMNYCRDGGTLTTDLSAGDKSAVRQLYPKPKTGSVNTAQWYNLITRVTALCIHVQGADSRWRNPLTQWECENGNQFKFRFKDVGGGFYQLISGFGTCFHVKSESGVDATRRAPIWQWECLNEEAFLFKLIDIGEGWYRLQSKNGSCLHVAGGPSSNRRQPLWTWECVNLPQFDFYFERTSAPQ